MKNLIRSSLVAAGLSLALTVAARAADSDAGYVDFGQLTPSAQGKFVEVNVSPTLLKFAARLAEHEEPESAALLSNLKHIRVNVVGLDDSNRAGMMEKIESVRHKLESQGWSQLVAVRDTVEGENVNIHIKQSSEDVIDGLVITVIDKKGEAVFVNIVGNIQADQIAKLAEKFDIEPLRKLHLKFDHKNEHKADDKQA